MNSIKQFLKKFKIFFIINYIRKKDIKCFSSYIRARKELHNIKKLESLDFYGFYLLSNININLFKKDKEIIERTIKQSLNSKTKIKIAFVVPFLSTWIGDKLFELFLNDSKFDSYILLSVFNNGTKDTSQYELNLMIQHFNSKNYPYKILDDTCTEWDYTNKPDILFYTSPYLDSLSPCIQLKSVPLSTLVLYTAYGFLLAKLEDTQFNLPIHNVAFKVYSHTTYYNKIALEYSSIKGENLTYSGYCKIDDLIDSTYIASNDNDLWKLVNNNQVKIIFAPHHSIGNASPRLGTFDMNYEYFYLYAKNHPETTSWIIKPHPVLRKTAVTEGLFQSINEYDDYLKKWDELPNAKVVTGEYVDYFLTSDCMILDSVSFIAEYLYTEKPMLFLSNGNNKFNDLGQELFNLIFKAKGDDFEKIEHFILNIKNNTLKNGELSLFFQKYLNYYDKNGRLARDFIYEDIKGI